MLAYLASDIIDVILLFDIKVIVYGMEDYNGSTDFTFSTISVEQSIQLRPGKQQCL